MSPLAIHFLYSYFYSTCVNDQAFCCLRSCSMADTSVENVLQNVDQAHRLVMANSRFAVDLYMKQSSVTSDNVFMSPISISFALAMVYLGARGNTMSQMRNVLHFGHLDETHLHQGFSDVLATVNRPNHAYTLHTANRLFGEKSYNFLEEYLTASRKYYGAELAAVDFIGDSTGARELINRWVSEKTSNKITDILPPDAVNSLTRLVLVNAIYFKSDWLKKFQVERTKEEDFHISTSESIKIPMMSMEKTSLHYGVSDELKCQAIELPYTGETLSMFIILPDLMRTNLSEVEEKLTVDHLVNIEEKFAMRSRELRVWIPRFRLSEKISLAETLANMGMSDLFSAASADLSGIDGSKNLFVSKVLHQAVLEVNEEGTEAAAATAVAVNFRMAPIHPLEFRADHPFLFFIQHKSTKSVLFLGRLVKPEAAQAPNSLT